LASLHASAADVLPKGDDSIGTLYRLAVDFLHCRPKRWLKIVFRNRPMGAGKRSPSQNAI